MASVISASTTSATALNMSADTTGVLQIATGATPTTAVTIDTSQNVGIGTTSPTQKLHLYGSGVDFNQRIEAPSGTNKYLDIGTGSSGHYLYGSGAYDLYFGTAGTERMRIDSSGRITTPNQPAFRARPSGSTNYTSINSVIAFDTVDTNIGSNYNSATSTFTAPVSGMYYFSLAVFAFPSTFIFAGFQVNGSAVDRIEFYGSNADYNQLSLSMIRYLNTNDYVKVIKGNAGGTLHVNGNTAPASNFSGFLIG